MNLDIAEVTLSATVDNNVMEITGREVLKWPQRMRHHVKVDGEFFNPYAIPITPIAYHLEYLPL